MLNYGLIITLFLATQYIPLDKKGTLTFTKDGEVQSLQFFYNKTGNNWIVELPQSKEQMAFKINQANYTIDGEILSGEQSMTNYIKFPQKPNWKTITQLEIIKQADDDDSTPILISKEGNKVLLKQEKGFLAVIGAIEISWEK